MLSDGFDGVGVAVPDTVGVGVGVGVVVVVSERIAERVGVPSSLPVVLVGDLLAVRVGVVINSSGVGIDAIGVLVLVLLGEREGVGVTVGNT